MVQRMSCITWQILHIASLVVGGWTRSADNSRLHHSHHGVGVENRVELQSEHEFFKTPEARNGHKYLQEMVEIPIIVTSLTRNHERRATMQERLHDMGARFQFLDAVDGREQLVTNQMSGSIMPWRKEGAKVTQLHHHQQPYLYNFSIPIECQSTPVAHMGCTLSHLLAIYVAWEAGLDNLLILEDDMEFLQWPSREDLASAPEEWGALQLYMLGGAADALYTNPPGPWVPWTPGIWNTGAYIINRDGMQRVLDIYMPGITSTGLLLTTELNFTSVVESPYCVADWVIYKAANTWVSTNFYFLESAQTSEITPGDLWIHQATRDLVEQLRGHRPIST